MTKIATLKKHLMNDQKFKQEYAKADADYAIVEALIRARAVAKLSQAEVAARIGTTQSAIARLEAGNVAPTLSTLRRYAEATGTKLKIGLVSVPAAINTASSDVDRRELFPTLLTQDNSIAAARIDCSPSGPVRQIEGFCEGRISGSS